MGSRNSLGSVVASYADHSNFTNSGDPDGSEPVVEHYGVNGMKWGVRKKQNRSSEVTVTETPGQKLKTSGGHDRPSSADAKQAAHYRQVAKSSTTDSLSNAELKLVVERMNLEQQYSKLTQNTAQVIPGQDFVQKLIKDAGANALTRVANEKAYTYIKKALT